MSSGRRGVAAGCAGGASALTPLPGRPHAGHAAHAGRRVVVWLGHAPYRRRTPPATGDASSQVSDPLTAVSAVAALLLIAAGVAKLRDPAATRDALALTRLPDSAAVVRSLGAGEVALGTAALAVGGPVALGALAAAYAAFAVFADRQRRAGSSCGCFGVEEAPLTVMHVLVDGLAAVAAGGAAVLAPTAALRTLPDEPVLAVTAIVTLVAATWAVRHLLTTLPALTALTDDVLAPQDGVLEVPGT